MVRLTCLKDLLESTVHSPITVSYTHLARDREASDYYMLLNGDDWKFKIVDKPADAIMYFQNDDYDTSDWDTIMVPCSWQMQGYDTPIYTNIPYPWTNYEDRGDGHCLLYTARCV